MNIVRFSVLLVSLLGCGLSCQQFIAGSCNHDRYFLEDDGKRMVHFRADSKGIFRCRVFDNKKHIVGALVYINEKFINKLNPSAMKIVLSICGSVEEQYFAHLEAHENGSRSFTYPGTKWCGPGDVAEDYDDLGEEWETDLCCRKHDHCPDYISPGKEKYGLLNNHIGTISLCSCDREFHGCLVKSEQKVSDEIGNMFFNILGMPCFDFEYPAVNCTRWGGFGNSQCQEYVFDKTQPKKWQFFDAQEYVANTEL